MVLNCDSRDFPHSATRTWVRSATDHWLVVNAPVRAEGVGWEVRSLCTPVKFFCSKLRKPFFIVMFKQERPPQNVAKKDKASCVHLLLAIAYTFQLYIRDAPVQLFWSTYWYLGFGYWPHRVLIEYLCLVNKLLSDMSIDISVSL